jgi:hypothetical protein
VEGELGMTKVAITRMWIAGLISLAIGLIIGGSGLGLMLAYGGHYTPATTGSGYEFVPTLNGFFWMTVSLMVAGFALAAAGGVAQLAAWVGALVNTYQLEEKTWFFALLAGGLLGLGFALVQFAAMVAYLVAGPDGMALGRPGTTKMSPGVPAPTGV